MKLILVRAKEPLHKAAKTKAKQEGRTLSGYIRWLITSDLEKGKAVAK